MLFQEQLRGNIFRTGLTFLDNTFTYIFNKKPRRGPLRIVWSITNKCNAKCIYCTAWKDGLSSKKELTTEESLSIIRQAGKLKVCSISFTGGEPLIRKDIFKLIKEAKKQGMLVKLNSNGLILKEKAKEIIESGVDTITIGIDSYKASYHDSIKRVPGIFERACEGIEELKKLKKGKSPIISIRGVVTNNNYKELDKYIDFWKDRVDSISLQPVHTGTESSIHNLEKGSENMKIKRIDEFSIYFKNLQKKYKFLLNAYYNEFPVFFSSPKSLLKKYKCFAGYYFLRIDPYGNCFQCPQMIKQVGNLKKNSLKEIWVGKEMTKWREIVREGKNKCYCWNNYFMMNIPLNKWLKPFFGGKVKNEN